MAFYTTAANRTANELVNYVRNNNRDCVQAHINILYIQKYVLGYPNTCVWKSISKGVQYLNRCSFDCSQELCKEEVQGEAMQALQSFFKTLHTLDTLPGWRKVYDFFRVQLANFGKHQQPTSLCPVLLDFESSSTETSFWLLPVIKTGKTYPGVAASSTFQNHDRGGHFKVRLPLIKHPQLQKSQKNICRNTDLQICSCFNSLMKQEKAKTKYTHDLCFSFVFIAN